ncbi:hypothetical protein ACETIH_17495 [Microvirga arabica]|uniref:HEPN domain-containing protein n=1 Tax=Microvirga arabica TaxID=1128671 RepID=A0ABV6YB10_9HYPH
MDDRTFTACAELSYKASMLLSRHQDDLRHSRTCLALSRELLARPVYPYHRVPPHNLLDVSGLKGAEPGK